MLELNLGAGGNAAKFKMISLAPRPVAASHVGVCHNEGKIYAVGGLNTSTAAATNFNVYDIATDTWSNLPNRPRASRSPQVGAANGKIFVYGGNTQQNNNALTQVDIFTIATNTWSVGPASTGRSDAGYIVINDELFIFGGAATGGSLITSCNKLKMSDPVAWSTLKAEPGFRYTGTLYDPVEKAIYLAGGQSSVLIDTFKQYNVDANTFDTLPSFPVVSHSTAGFFTPRGEIAFYSGYNNAYSSKMYVFDREKQEWKEELLLDNKVIHGLPGSVQVGDELYLVGGFSGSARIANLSKISRVS